MAQTSLPQGGSGVGDAGPYSSDEWAEYMQVVYTGDQQATQGVLIRYLNELAVTNPIAATIRIATGAGFVNGHLLINKTSVDVNVNLCGVVGQTRWNRVVMVENNTNVLYSPGNLLFPAAYAAGIVRNTAKLAILQGSCGTPGGLPALVQNANYWYTEIARFQVTSASPGVITDYREYCQFSTEVVAGMIADDAVTAPAIAAGAVGTSEIAAGAVTTTEILNNTIVAGDVANETLTPTQILNRTRRFLVQATNCEEFSGGIPTGTKRACYQRGWQMPDDEGSSANGYFIVPDDFASGISVEHVIVIDGFGVGNLVYAYAIQWSQCDEAWDGSQTSNWAFDATETGLNRDDRHLCFASKSLAGASAGDIVHLAFRRDGGDIGDTIGYPVYFVGWMVEYTADS